MSGKAQSRSSMFEIVVSQESQAPPSSDIPSFLYDRFLMVIFQIWPIAVIELDQINTQMGQTSSSSVSSRSPLPPPPANRLTNPNLPTGRGGSRVPTKEYQLEQVASEDV